MGARQIIDAGVKIACLTISFYVFPWLGTVNASALYDPESEVDNFLEVPSTNWQEFNQSLYSEVLSAGEFDLLVVPFQIRNHGIDLAGRYLMTRYMVAYLEATTKLRIPDPLLIEKALGERSRRIDAKSVYDLANKLKVKTLVWTYVGHDNKEKVSFTVRVQEKTDDILHVKTPLRQKDWDNIKFTDLNLPSDVLLSRMTEITEFITKQHQELTRKKYIDVNPVIPDKLMQLVSTKDENPILTAYNLQLFGVLHPLNNPLQVERLFARSLVALITVPPDRDDYKLIRARALLYLHRRPAALAALEGLETNEAMALRSYINGNLHETEKFSNQIEQPVLKLMSHLEFNQMRFLYSSFTLDNDMLHVDNYSDELKYFVNTRLNSTDVWKAGSNIRVKTILDSSFSVPGYTAETMVKGKLAARESIGHEFALSVVEHEKKLLQENVDKWCCSESSWRISKWDYLNLLTGIAESNIISGLAKVIKNQGHYDRGLKSVRDIALVYDGHPLIIYLQSYAKNMLARNKSGLTKENLVKEAKEERRKIFLWSGGQYPFVKTGMSYTLNNNKDDFFSYASKNPKFKPEAYIQLYLSDFPNRPAWSVFFNMTDHMKKRLVKHNMQYAMSNLVPFESAYRQSDSEGKKAILSEIQGRFNGSPSKIKFMAKIKRNEGDFDGEHEIYKKAIQEKSVIWYPYFRLARWHITQGQYRKGYDVFMSYPLFQDEGEADGSRIRLAVSNNAYEAGSSLFWRGAYDEAQVLFELAEKTKTGASSEMSSKIRNALIDNDYATAVSYAFARAKRYKSRYSYRDFMYLMHVIKQHKSAWDLFDSLLNRLEAPQIWSSVFIGHRVQGDSPGDVIDWIKQPHIVKAKISGQSMAANYAFKALSVDRSVNNELPELLGELLIESGAKDKTVLKNYKMYQALKKKDYKAAYDALEDKNEIQSSIVRRKEIWIPYITWTYVNNDKKNYLETLDKLFKDQVTRGERKDPEKNYGKRFDYHLSKAFLEGGRGNNSEAIRNLKHAFDYRPHTNIRPLYTWYQLVEACEWLYERNKDQAYIDQALKWVKDYQVVQPMFAWAYAFEAKYTTDPVRRNRALAFALYLDKHSAWIKDIPESEKNAAKSWFEINNPFNIKQKIGNRPT